MTKIRAMLAVVASIGAAVAAAAQMPTQPAEPMRPMAMAAMAATPKVGDTARDFSLKSLDGATVRLSEEAARGPVVLVVLRGWPGYQCPFCTRQFGDYLANAEKFAARGARLLFVYPGPAAGLQEHAKAFTDSRPMPANFRILPDPDYTFTNAYGLRWDAPMETAYPSTFILDGKRVITFAEISHEHGGRVPAVTVLDALARR